MKKLLSLTKLIQLCSAWYAMSAQALRRGYCARAWRMAGSAPGSSAFAFWTISTASSGESARSETDQLLDCSFASFLPTRPSPFSALVLVVADGG